MRKRGFRVYGTKKSERDEDYWDYRLSVMPRETTVDVGGESGGEENGGNTQPRREGFECPISCFTHHSHSTQLFASFFLFFTHSF